MRPVQQSSSRKCVGKSVLIADDHEDVRRILRSTLESAGLWVCAEASNGLAALKKAEEFLPDVIVLDSRMPIINGAEAASILHDRFPNVPIVLISAFQIDEDIQATPGICAVVDKAEAVRRLPECIEQLLK